MNKPDLKFLVGVYLLASLLSTLILIVVFFPTVQNDVWTKNDSFSSAQMNLITLVILTGALGSYVHLVSSFTSYVGNRQFVESWTWWYLFKPFIGMCIALVFFLLLNAGMIPSGADSKVKDLYWALSIAGMVGIFNDKAIIKLEEIFDVVFKPTDKRSDKLNESLMLIESSEPKVLKKDFSEMLKIVGQKFPADGVVVMNGRKQISKRLSSVEILVEKIELQVDPLVASIEVKVASDALKMESKPYEIKLE